MAHPQGWEVGMDVCVVYTENVRGEPNPITANITKVGRKWITTACIQGFTTRFDAETMYIDGGRYSSPGKVYVDERAYHETTSLHKLWRDFRSYLPYAIPDHLTIGDVSELILLVQGPTYE
jgi:hypothetical protein